MVKNPPANAGDVRPRFSPCVGKIPWRRTWHPLQSSCLENPMHRGAWWATVHRVAKRQTGLRQLSARARVCTHTHTHTHTQLVKSDWIVNPETFLTTSPQSRIKKGSQFSARSPERGSPVRTGVLLSGRCFWLQWKTPTPLTCTII